MSSFRLIIHCYHIHMIEWSKSTCGFQSYHMLLLHSFQGMGQIQYDEFQDFSSKIYYFSSIIILSQLWCIETQTQCLIHTRHISCDIIRLEPNTLSSRCIKTQIESYPFGAIGFESIVLSSTIFHCVHLDLTWCLTFLVRWNLNQQSYP